MNKKLLLYINIIIILSLSTSCANSKEAPIKSTNVSIVSSSLPSELESYQQAVNAIKEKRYPQAIGILSKLGDYKASKLLLEQLRYLINGSFIGNGIWAVGAITADKGVTVSYYDSTTKKERYNVEPWKNISSISFRGGDSIEGLSEEGKIVTTSATTKEILLASPVTSTNAMANVVESVSSWSNIAAFQSFYHQTAVALTKDGFVYAAYPYYQDGTVKLQAWKDIIAVADGRSYVSGLKKDGTVLCNVYDYIGSIDIKDWKNIVAISASTSLIGLKEDGTVISTGMNKYDEGNVSSWTDIIAISTSTSCTLGLKRDGTVIATGKNTFGQMSVTGWKDIVAIAAGEYFSIGLKSDGTMVLAGDCTSSGAKTPDVSELKGLLVPLVTIN